MWLKLNLQLRFWKFAYKSFDIVVLVILVQLLGKASPIYTEGTSIISSYFKQLDNIGFYFSINGV